MPQLADPPPPTDERPAARRSPVLHRPTVLRGVTWEEYVGLRAKPENEHVKLTYDGPNGGLLEIERPNGLLHETVSRMLAALILAFCEERKLSVRPSGAVTQNREDLRRGLEGDESFYLAHAEALRRRNHVDLAAGDPPPDLCVEVDVTSPGVAKLPIYAALGVPEVWVWADDALTVHRRTGDDGYKISEESGALPGFPVAFAAELIARRDDAEHFALLKQFRDRVRPAA
ncbi:Uma2 family endonuclease [Alienimonas sp. DA493]|uniref:Uma2 family endonuclease n=1 Tax=Alienimonas sp. DA493 TaxID=3373605 RepID=UPI003754E1F3